MPGPLYKFLYNKLQSEPKRWHPLLAVYYLTYACDFRCPYCSDGAQNPYYKLRSRVLEPLEVLDLLGRIRSHCAHVVLTGGEPLKHPGFAQILEGLPSLKFQDAILTTNGHELAPHLELAVRSVTQLVFSVDTLDVDKADRWHGVGAGSLERILRTIEEADRVRPSRCQITISAVVTPDNILDLREVYRWASAHHYVFAACPQLVGVKAHPALEGNPAYRALFDLLIAEKRAGGKVFGTIPYLERLRDLAPFRCRPLTMLVVSPTGDVFFPCLEKGEFIGNLLADSDLQQHLRKGLSKWGRLPECGVQCHSACALGFATALDKPWALVQEAWSAFLAH